MPSDVSFMLAANDKSSWLWWADKMIFLSIQSHVAFVDQWFEEDTMFQCQLIITCNQMADPASSMFTWQRGPEAHHLLSAAAVPQAIDEHSAQ